MKMDKTPEINSRVWMTVSPGRHFCFRSSGRKFLFSMIVFSCFIFAHIICGVEESLLWEHFTQQWSGKNFLKRRRLGNWVLLGFLSSNLYSIRPKAPDHKTSLYSTNGLASFFCETSPKYFFISYLVAAVQASMAACKSAAGAGK